MLIHTCKACGHTNLWLASQCGGCGIPFPRRVRPVSWRNLAFVWAICALLLGVSALGVYLIVLRLLPPIRALLFQ